jgi:hypothetical protein
VWNREFSVEVNFLPHWQAKKINEFPAPVLPNLYILGIIAPDHPINWGLTRKISTSRFQIGKKTVQIEKTENSAEIYGKDICCWESGLCFGPGESGAGVC